MAIANLQISVRNEDPQDPGNDSLNGDYLEFGVYQGDTFIHTFHRAKNRLPKMRFFAFDSFEGLPELQGSDVGGEFSAGQFSCSHSDFISNLRKERVDLGRVTATAGWFDRSLSDGLKAQHNLHIASLTYIDCDLYESCVPVLAFLTSLLRQGSFLFFDDWYCFRNDPNRGVQRATAEWLTANPSITLTDWFPFSHHGKAFIVNCVRQTPHG